MKYLFTQLNKKYFLASLVFGLSLFAYTISANAVTTDCSSNLSSSGSYTVTATTTHTCNITTSGVSLDGGGHAIGPVAQALPDNATNGWLNMTGNLLLYHMNDVFGGTDSVGGNPLMATGNVTATSGKLSNAVNFGGSGAYMSSANNNVAAQSLTAWVRFNGFTGGYQKLFRGDDDGFCFGLTPGNHWEACGGDAGSGPSLNTWYFIAIVHGQGVYINGVLTSLTAPASLSGVHKLNLGGPPYSEWSKSSIDELALWSGTLTQGQITTMYNSGAGTVLAGNESGLVDLYHFNQSSFLPSVTDTSGQSHTGTVSGGVTSGSTGKVSGALTLDGNNNSYISTTVTGFNTQHDHTVMFWAYIATAPQDGTEIFELSDGSSCNGNPGSYVGNAGSGVLEFNGCASGGSTIVGNLNSMVGTWNLIGYTYTGGTIKTYLNGANVNTSSFTFTNVVSPKLTIFANQGGGQNTNGKIDEFALWNRVLTPTEVATMYSTQVGGASFTGNGFNFSLTNVIASGITSAGATVTIANSTVATVNVTGANNTGNGSAGGTINLTNTTAGDLIANGGNSTDNGVGGTAGTINLTNSTASSQTAKKGNCGPNSTDPSCFNIFNGNAGDGDWDNAGNWSTGFVPGSTDSVAIQSNVTQVSNNDASVATAAFSNGAVWDPNYNYLVLTVTGTTTFNDTSYHNYGQIITKNAVFNDSSFANGDQIDGDGTGVVIFNGSGTYNTANLYNFSNVDFNNGAYNTNNNSGYIQGNATFENGSYNQYAEIDGTATFTGGSYDYNGYFLGQDYFYDTSYAQGTNFAGGISPIFYGNSSEYIPGTVNGIDLTRYFTTDTVVGPRDFTADDSPWIITADNAVVDLSSATCNANTQFVPVNGGSFVYGPNCLAGPVGVSIVSPTSDANLSAWSPLVNWNQGAGGYDYTGCQYEFGAAADWDAPNNDWLVGSPEAGHWNGISCTDSGATTISTPSIRGSQILAVRAYFAGGGSHAAATSSATVQFTWTPSRLMYFYKTGSDASWTTSANWYTNSSHTTLANGVPTAFDKVTILGTTSPSVNLDNWVQPSLINSGTVGVSFTSASHASSTVTINGAATYSNSAINHGTVNGSVTFNNTASNTGTVKNNAVFNDSSSNTSIVLGNATFNADLSANSGTIRGIKTRYYNATTTTVRNLAGWTVVADGVTVDVSGAIHDATTVFRTANGGSFIGGPTAVYWWSNGSDTKWTTVSHWFSDAATTTPLGRVASSTETVITLGSSTPTIDLVDAAWIMPSGIDATKTGLIITASTTQHISTGITGSTTISGHVVNDSSISGETFFHDVSYNSSIGVVSGTAHFFDTAYNNGGSLSGDAVFNNSSRNTNGGTVAGDVTFNDGSYNDTTAGAISGTATFNNTAHNDGTIGNDAVFTNNLTENNGTVQGTKTRYWNNATTTARDFVTTGPWTLVADGVTVTVASSSVFSTTTTFTTVNSGHFTGEGLPGSTTCTKPLIFPGTYTLSADTSNTCTIQSSGVIIDGNGHTIGHLPQAFPNGGGSSGWMNMTGNVALYHMNDTSGNIVDSSGNSNTGTPTGVTLPGPTGVIGTALSFDGSNVVSVPDSSSFQSLNTTNAITISFWAKTTALNCIFPVLTNKSLSGWGSQGFELIMINYQDRAVFFNPGLTSNGGYFYSTNDAISNHLNQWTHFVVTYDRGAQTSAVYINGTSMPIGTDGTPLYNTAGGNNVLNSSAPLSIGGLGNDTNGRCPFVGQIDEFSIWNRALSPAEAVAIYTNQSNSGFNAIVGNGNSFSLTGVTTAGSILSAGATVSIANSTVSTVNVSGADAAGDAQAGGTIILTNHTTAGALIANGGNSTDYGYGGTAGTISVDGTSSASSQTNNPGSNGPNKGNGQSNTGGGGGGGTTIVGCTDPSASNYSSAATVDNGSCRYASSQVRGCTDPSATNFNFLATINDGSCHYPVYTPYVPPSNGNGGNNGNGNNGNAGLQGVTIPVAALGGQLMLHPLPAFTTDISTSSLGATVLGNPLAGLKPLGSLKLTIIPFSLGLPISSFLFAPLPKSITTALSKAPKLSDTLASVGISRAQDLVKLDKRRIKLPISENTPGLFTVVDGTTTLDTYIANDSRYDLVELVTANPGDILDVSLVPLSKGKVLAAFDDKVISFSVSGKTTVKALVTAPSEPGLYILATDAAPLPLVIEVVAPQPPPNASTVSLPWWRKFLNWVTRSSGA